MPSKVRKATLASTLAKAGPGIRFNEHIEGDGPTVFAHACKMALERFWRSVKYEEVYLRAYDSVDEARVSLRRYIHFYNGHRPHSSLDGRTPDQAYFNSLPFRVAA
jgi:Integrase core domain